MRTQNCVVRRVAWIMLAGGLAFLVPALLNAQANVEKEHRRGKLWELIRNDGWIGTLGAWDFLVTNPLGMYPGFKDWTFPFGNEDAATNTYSNANYHNFRSGCWIIVKDMLTPGGPPTYDPTPTPYEIYESGLQESFLPGGVYGGASVLQPLDLKQNFIENPGFDPRLPEEMTDGSWYTNTGIRVTRRSSVWSFPGYSDFIIYDYTFKYTGDFVANSTRQLVPAPDTLLTRQNLSGVYFVFHSGVGTSTKSNINFYDDVYAIMAGGFGWKPDSWHDYYHHTDNDELVFSTNYDGGRDVPPKGYSFRVKPDKAWRQKFGNELLSPAAFGWLALYADPLPGRPARTSPRPDFLRIDSHAGGTFQGMPLLMEYFRQPELMGKSNFFAFATTPDTQAALGNKGDRFNFYTFTYGPYRMAPGDSVRIILAEIAGVMDYSVVNAGDPNHWFPDSSIAAIRRNAQNARNAVRWGLGGSANGIPLAADVPEPPPAPHTTASNNSEGTQRAIIGVTWDDIAETAVIHDGANAVFYNGANDLSGYRIYRSTDFQFATDQEPPVFRGATWTLLADIPRAAFSSYRDAGTGQYVFRDTTVAFGFRCAYYVAAYNSTPRTWTSANGTVVSNLPTLESSSVNRSEPTSASPGPVMTFDVFVTPNPHVFNDPLRSFGQTDPYKLEFRNLPERCSIRIYTLMGDLVWSVEHRPDKFGNLSGSEAWDQRSSSGLRVAPGLYVYHIESSTPGLDKKLTGKLMIIR